MNALTDRRSILRGVLTASSVAAVPASVAAETLDPVLALIAAHKAAWASFDGIDLGDHEALEEAGRAADAALAEIANTPPATLAGMRAVIEYLVELDGHEDYLPTLLRSSLLRSPLPAA